MYLANQLHHFSCAACDCLQYSSKYSSRFSLFKLLLSIKPDTTPIQTLFI